MSRVIRYGILSMVSLFIAYSARGVAAAANEQTLQGEVVDPALYLKEGRHGAELEEQTYEAVDGGQTLALLDADGKTLYLFLAEQSGEDPNELAYDYVNRKVKVTGTVYARDGVHGIVPTNVEPLEPPQPPAATTPPAAAAPPTTQQSP